MKSRKKMKNPYNVQLLSRNAFAASKNVHIRILLTVNNDNFTWQIIGRVTSEDYHFRKIKVTQAGMNSHTRHLLTR